MMLLGETLLLQRDSEKFCCCCCLIAKSCLILVTPWTLACQTRLSMGFPRQEYWHGLPFPSLRDLPDSGIEPTSLALAGDSLPLSHQGSTLEKLYRSEISPDRFDQQHILGNQTKSVEVKSSLICQEDTLLGEVEESCVWRLAEATSGAILKAKDRQDKKPIRTEETPFLSSQEIVSYCYFSFNRKQYLSVSGKSSQNNGGNQHKTTQRSSRRK